MKPFIDKLTRRKIIKQDFSSKQFVQRYKNSFYFQNIVMELVYEDKNKEVIIQFYNKPNIKKNYP